MQLCVPPKSEPASASYPPYSEPVSAPTKTLTSSSLFADQLGAKKRLYETLRALRTTLRPRNKRASERLPFPHREPASISFTPLNEPASAPTQSQTSSSVLVGQLGANKRLRETLRALRATPCPTTKRASERPLFPHREPASTSYPPYSEPMSTSTQRIKSSSVLDGKLDIKNLRVTLFALRETPRPLHSEPASLSLTQISITA